MNTTPTISAVGMETSISIGSGMTNVGTTTSFPYQVCTTDNDISAIYVTERPINTLTVALRPGLASIFGNYPKQEEKSEEDILLDEILNPKKKLLLTRPEGI